MNLTRGGRSSGSIRAEGTWDKLERRAAIGGQFGATYALLQFGHTTRLPERLTDLLKQSGVTPLSQDEQTALAVGQRHGKLEVLKIKARLMHEQGLFPLFAVNLSIPLWCLILAPYDVYWLHF